VRLTLVETKLSSSRLQPLFRAGRSTNPPKLMKKLFVLIAVVATLFTFAPTKAEARYPYRFYPSYSFNRGAVCHTPVRYYNSRSYRPVYYNHRYYRSVPRYYPSYRSSRYYVPRYSSYHGYRGPAVSVHTRFGSFYIR